MDGLGKFRSLYSIILARSSSGRSVPNRCSGSSSSPVSYALFYTALLFNLLPILESRGFSTAQAIALYSLIGPAQLAGRLCFFAVDRVMPVVIAGLAGTLLPVAAMAILMLLSPPSMWSVLFPILFGTGIGIKTVVQATAAPEFLGQTGYGTLQGLISMPIYIAQAASPFIAALIWQASGTSDVLEQVLLVTAIFSAASFACAAKLAPHRGAPG